MGLLLVLLLSVLVIRLRLLGFPELGLILILGSSSSIPKDPKNPFSLCVERAREERHRERARDRGQRETERQRETEM